MSDTTRATTFDDLGSDLRIFSTATNQFVYRYVDVDRNKSMLAVPGQVVDLGDWSSAQTIIRGSGPEQMFVRGDLLFVSQLHSDKVEVFHINRAATDPSQVLTQAGFEFTGGITPQGIAVSPDGRTVYVANMQTEDISFLAVDANGNLTRQGTLPVGVTGTTPDPTTGGNGAGAVRDRGRAGTALVLQRRLLRRRPEIVRLLPLAEPARRFAVERRRRMPSAGRRFRRRTRTSRTTGRSGSRV